MKIMAGQSEVFPHGKSMIQYGPLYDGRQGLDGC